MLGASPLFKPVILQAFPSSQDDPSNRVEETPKHCHVQLRHPSGSRSITRLSEDNMPILIVRSLIRNRLRLFAACVVDVGDGEDAIRRLAVVGAEVGVGTQARVKVGYEVKGNIAGIELVEDDVEEVW